MNLKVKVLVAFVIIVIVSCATNPFTGKSTLAFVPNNKLIPMSLQQYDQFLKENKVIEGTKQAQSVQNVGVRIKQAAEKWLNANGYSQYLKDYRWEYKLVDDPAVNAWCMPGGKICFYSGIMPVCKDDAGVATVMGHEVAHALANHGQQRMSGGILQQVGAAAVSVSTQNASEKKQQQWMTAYGAGSQVFGMLPFSRSHESEADKIGLTLMAMAGYNPEHAIAFWQRMASATGNENKPPEFMSTHPSHNTRINNIKTLIPQAKAEAAKYGVKF